jgi:FKBP-type peptidyl-prolyl cis-trans isomerase
MTNDTQNAATTPKPAASGSPMPLIALMVVALFGASYVFRSGTVPPPPSKSLRTSVVQDTTMPAAFKDHLPWDPKGKDVQSAGMGLQYIVLKKGPGGKSPTTQDNVTVHYEGRRTTGEKFDSSFDRGEPATFPLDAVIPGWTMGLQEMSEGDEYLFYIPSALAYGDSPRPGGLIKPGDDLVFLVQLISVDAPKSADAEAWQKYFPWPSAAPEVVKLPSGLQYTVLASGDAAGKPPARGQYVVVHYEGRLADTGALFDSSYERGEPAAFPSDALIPGWVEALALMKPGDRWMLYIPADLAYGKRGTPGGPIPPDAPLQFEVELVSVME